MRYPMPFARFVLLTCLLLLASTTAMAAAQFTSLSVGAQSGVVTYGMAGSVTYVVTVTATGNGNNSPSCTFGAVTGLPAGVSASFGTNSVTRSGAGTVTSTLTLTTTVATTQAVTGSVFTVSCNPSSGGTLSDVGSLTVAPKALTVTATNSSKTYGTAVALGTAAFTSVGLANNDAISGVTLTSGGSAATAAAGSYSIVPSSAVFLIGTAANYVITYTNGTLTVNLKTLIVTATNRSKTYGTAVTFAGTEFGTSTGLVNGDTVTGVTLTSSGAAATATVAGSPYSIVPSAATGTGVTNYAFIYVNGSLTVTARAITVTADAKSKNVGAADPALTYQITSGSLVNGDTFTGALTRVAGESAGTYAIQVGTLALSSNYALTFVSANLTINNLAPIVTKSFGQTTIAANGTSTLTIGIINPNSGTITGLAFTDSYPGNLKNASTPALTNSCGGTAVGNAGGTSLSFSGGSLAGASSCSVSVAVTASVDGSYVNNTGAVTSSNSNSGASAQATLTVTAISAANSTVSASPTSVAADGSTISTITVTLKDGANIGVSGKTVTLAAGSGSSTITTVSGTTNASGVATFTVKDSVAQSVKYTATDATDTITVTQTATVTFGASGAASTVVASPTSVPADGSTTSTITVTLKDGIGNLLSGKTVTLTAGSGSSTIATVSGTTNASGVATFTVKDAVAESVTYTATDTTDGVTITQTASVTFTSALTVAKNFSPVSIAANTTSTLTVTITNPNSVGVGGVAFTDSYPSTDLKNASTPALTNTCNGTPTGAANGNSLRLTGGTIAANSQCSVSVAVTSSVAGSYVNNTGAVTSTNAISGTSAQATLVVGPSTTNSTVVANPTSVVADGSTTSTITVTLKDGADNAVTGKTVTLSAGSGSSIIAAVSNVNGVATFLVKNSTVESVTYTATDITDSITIGSVTVSFTSTATSFNAFETSYFAPAIDGKIFTKIAGAGFTLSVVAIAGGTPATSFTDNVNVELLANTAVGTGYDAVNNCPTTYSVIQGPTSVAISSGRSDVAFSAVPNVYRDVRVRISYPTLPSSCSTDSFAIRPATFGVLVRDHDRTSEGTDNTLDNLLIPGNTVHNAGRPFRITATAYNAASTPVVTSNYTGTLTIGATSACIGAACTATVGTLTLGTWSSESGGTMITSTASYNDVGAFALQLQDTTFASVDANPDGSMPDESIVKSSTIAVGRFVPDHFSVDLTSSNQPTLTTRSDMSCSPASDFTYMGEPFSLSYRIEARAGATPNTDGTTGVVTPHYTGSLGNVALQAENGNNGTDYGTRLTNATANNWTNGINSVNTTNAIFTRLTTHEGPFDSLQIGVVVTDTDGSVLEGRNMNPATTTDCAVLGNCTGVAIGTTKIRFGKLKLSNAHGSELLTLPIPIETQYWNGISFITNTSDSCTSIFSPNNVTFDNYLGGINTGNMASPGSVNLGGTFNLGKGSLILAKPIPAPAQKGSVNVTVKLDTENKTYLQSGSTFSSNPTIRATFGIYKSGPVIYMREIY